MDSFFSATDDIQRLVILAFQPFLLYFLKRMISSLDKLIDKVDEQNGRVTRLETWRDGHNDWSGREITRLRDEISDLKTFHK